jgi:hypothetical protein
VKFDVPHIAFIEYNVFRSSALSRIESYTRGLQMGIEINFFGRLEPSRVEEFSNALDELVRSMEGWTKRSHFQLPDDVVSYVKDVRGALTITRQAYPRPARGELVLVWEVMVPSFISSFAICCNIDWKGATVLYETKNWGSAYPLVTRRERLTHGGCDPTIYEVPVCIRRSHQLQGHLDAIRIVDLIKDQFIPGLWVQDDTGYYENRDIKSIEEAHGLIKSWLCPHFSGSFSAPDHLKDLSQAELLGTPVHQLELGIRYILCLKRAGILTIGDLANKKLSDIRPIKNMTEQGIRYIREVMESLGFSLSE